ncbi:nitrous oxide reductase accessory protein NosL [Flaviaesturariibacter aridisoli]|uniref:nitrous oxide reductase accessory protein NosL n=1 Tax=Flaviaesturariibacter aridisoli TaxID=2545761 RepID=UPI001404B488|nr:nitrous oxide reductase accessory protein NosL [Flaviaesturariibacter aridisoli]
MQPKMRPLSRILIALAALSLGLTFVLPVWFIFLMAPQYPEGLTMYIWLDRLSGQVDIINGLNHYIGMKHINEKMFPEFHYLGTIVGVFIALGLLVAASGRRKHLFAYLLLLLAAAGTAMYDFYQWGYDYGHHLDPHAAIQVPGLFYQPPLLGHKQLLNFDAYSYPDTGGWIVIGAGLLCFAVWGWERFLRRGVRPQAAVRLPQPGALAACVLVAAALSACSSGPKPFVAGRDACDDCRMTIVDTHYGAELITRKGRLYKFDDLHCLARFRKSNPDAAKDAQLYFADYTSGNLLPAAAAWSLTDSFYKTPMNSHSVSFASRAAALAEGKGTPTQGAELLGKL